MIYDCFIFFNELDILEIRFNTLDSIVDKFVICESTKDHANRPKPLFFEENKKRFKKFLHKIIYIKVDDTPNTNLVWVHVDHQWQAVTRGLKNCKPNDTILVSDADEIPKPERVLQWKDKPGSVKVFQQSLSYYYLNCVEYASGPWEGTRMMKYKDLKHYRMHAVKNLIPDVRIPDGGWHFSYIGDVEKIQTKITTSGHQEFNTEKYKTAENITMAIAEGRDFLNHGLKFKVVDKSFLPKYVLENQSRYGKMIIGKFEKQSFRYYTRLIFLKVKHRMRLLYRDVRGSIKNLIS